MQNTFLHAEGRKIVDGNGQEILLTGWGLGNWMVQEGYMWKSSSKSFDRPTRIENAIEKVAGTDYAMQFWKQFREDYVRREDIMQMAKLGYNSVRIPMHYKLFMTDGDAVEWKQEGFRLLDRCIEWCEEAGLYVFLDLHAAPGGQTGANIDDSADDVPRLFLERKNQEKCIALWTKLAERYRDKEIIGGYDLLNEPIAPPEAGYGDFDYLIPKLAEFYHELIHAIREVDPFHLISLEGAHWATDVSIFKEHYDDNAVLHFHRYAEIPDKACLQKYIEVSKRMNMPLWMGETGENVNEWFAALYPLAHSLGIGYNVWPWKKMDCTNSPYSIRRPKSYQKILDAVEKGEKISHGEAQQILDEYLKNIRMENCEENSLVTNHVFRKPPFTLRATDFDPASEGKYSRDWQELEPERKRKFVFDCQWDRFGLMMHTGEQVCYQVGENRRFEVEVVVAGAFSEGVLAVGRENGKEEFISVNSKTAKFTTVIEGGEGRLIIRVTEGKACLEKLMFKGEQA